ncbi:6-O-methylguanine DNA methyltransferase, partial [Mycena vulgaris]
DGQRVTPHQWAVYDFTLTIPTGKVVTYKDVCQAVGGSPRSVGGALRTNPFAPFVPCHRVIASSLFIGGFLGEWGKEHRTGTQCNRKLDLLSKEGVGFTPEGYLKGAEMLWKGDAS